MWDESGARRLSASVPLPGKPRLRKEGPSAEGKSDCQGAMTVPARPPNPGPLRRTSQRRSARSPTRRKTKTAMAAPEVPPHPLQPTRKRPNPDRSLVQGSRPPMALFPEPIAVPPNRCLGDQEGRTLRHGSRDTNYITQKRPRRATAPSVDQ